MEPFCVTAFGEFHRVLDVVNSVLESYPVTFLKGKRPIGLQKKSQPMLEDLLLTFTKESGQSPMIGAMDGMSLHARQLFLLLKTHVCLWRDKGLLVPA